MRLPDGALHIAGRRHEDSLEAWVVDPWTGERVAPVIDAWTRADLPFIRLDGTRDVDVIARELLDEVARLEAV